MAYSARGIFTTWSCHFTDDPQDAQVARQYLSTPEEFAATAKFWTESYASSEPGVDAKVRCPFSALSTALSRRTIQYVSLYTQTMSLLDGLWVCNHSQLQRVMEMGFPEAEAREALEKHGGDENAAVNSLLGM